MGANTSTYGSSPHSVQQLLAVWETSWQYGLHEQPGIQTVDSTGSGHNLPPIITNQTSGLNPGISSEAVVTAADMPSSYSYPTFFVMDEETGDYLPSSHYQQTLLSIPSTESSNTCTSWQRLLTEHHAQSRPVAVDEVVDVTPTTPKYFGFHVSPGATTSSPEPKDFLSQSSISTDRSLGSPSKVASTLTQALQAAGRTPSPRSHVPLAHTLRPIGYSESQPTLRQDIGSSSNRSPFRQGAGVCGDETGGRQSAPPSMMGDLTVRGAGLYAQLMQNRQQQHMDTGGLSKLGRPESRAGDASARMSYPKPAFRSEPINAYVIASASDSDSSPYVSKFASPSGSPSTSPQDHHPSHATISIPYQPTTTTSAPSYHLPIPYQPTTTTTAPSHHLPISAFQHSLRHSSDDEEGGLGEGVAGGARGGPPRGARSKTQPIAPPRRYSMDVQRRESSASQWRSRPRQDVWESTAPADVMYGWRSSSNHSEAGPLSSALAAAAQHTSYGDLLRAASIDSLAQHSSYGEIGLDSIVQQQQQQQAAMWGSAHCLAGSHNSTVLA